MDMIDVGLGIALLGVIAYLAFRNTQKGGDFELESFVSSMVEAAEQMFRQENGKTREQTNKARLDYVMDKIKLAFPGVPETLARAFVEAAVGQLRRWNTNVVSGVSVETEIDIDDLADKVADVVVARGIIDIHAPRYGVTVAKIQE